MHADIVTSFGCSDPMVFSGDEVKASNAEAVGMALHSAFIELDDQILKRAVVRLREYMLTRPCFRLVGC